jgi:DNA adenine methylase
VNGAVTVAAGERQLVLVELGKRSVGARPRPFLKWAGSKRALAPTLAELSPWEAGTRLRHVEPFVGGGGFFFARCPGAALIADVNARLVRAYEAVRDAWGEVHAALEVHRACDSQAHYYTTRAALNRGAWKSPACEAAAFIYLNKTGFNGLYRENRRGELNVPWGKRSASAVATAGELAAAASALRGAVVRCADFEATLAEVSEGDFVYLDPPYVAGARAFTAYTAGGFGERDLERLAAVSHEAARRGALLMLSHCDTTLVRSLFRGWRVFEVSAVRNVGCTVSARGRVTELVLCSFG